MVNEYYWQRWQQSDTLADYNSWRVFTDICSAIFAYANQSGDKLVGRTYYSAQTLRWEYPDTPPINNHQRLFFAAEPPFGFENFEMSSNSEDKHSVRTEAYPYHKYIAAILLAGKIVWGDLFHIGADDGQDAWTDGLALLVQADPDLLTRHFPVSSQGFTFDEITITGNTTNVTLVYNPKPKAARPRRVGRRKKATTDE